MPRGLIIRIIMNRYELYAGDIGADISTTGGDGQGLRFDDDRASADAVRLDTWCDRCIDYFE